MVPRALPAVREAVLAGALAAAFVAAAPLEWPNAVAAPAPVLPAWDPTGVHDVRLPVGFASLDGKFEFGSVPSSTTTLDGRTGSFDIRYDASARLVAAGFLDDFTFLTLSGSWSVGTDGTQTVVLSEQAKRPRFRFEGAMQPGGREIRGTYDRSPGFLGLTGTVTDRELVLVLEPSQPTADPTFRLRAQLTMNRSGAVQGTKGIDGKESKARIDVFGDRALEGGVVRGRVKTSRTDGTTAARVKIRGKGWKVVLDGPLDEQGFHALVDVKAGGFVVTGVPITLPVAKGPEPPPPPPPPDPPNLVSKGIARIVAGQVQITRRNMPSKYFGTGADATIEFPASAVGDASIVANPSTSAGAGPRRVTVEVGSKAYGTVFAGGDVSMSIRRDLQGNLIFSTIPGQTIEVVCAGTIADATGRTKPVDVIVRATVTQ